MAIILGLIVALTYGSGDFFGGLAAKRTPASSVVVGSFLVSTGCLLTVTIGWAIVGGLPHPVGHDLLLGVAVGLVGPTALGLLYRGLASGRMSVVAPITAVVAAISATTAPIAIAGAVVALIAVGLISGAPAHPDHVDLDADGDAMHPASGVVTGAVVSGLGFGAIFILLGSTSAHAGLWPLLVARPVAIVATVVALALWSRRTARPLVPAVWPTRNAWSFAAVSGVLDITANGTYLAATHRGLLSIVAVLSSLYPASTVVLARVFLQERLHRVQLIGLLLAAAGVAAMAVS